MPGAMLDCGWKPRWRRESSRKVRRAKHDRGISASSAGYAEQRNFRAAAKRSAISAVQYFSDSCTLTAIHEGTILMSFCRYLSAAVLFFSLALFPCSAQDQPAQKPEKPGVANPVLVVDDKPVAALPY